VSAPSSGPVVVEEGTESPTALGPRRSWTFITNHAQVLLAVARNPFVRVSDIAQAANITERYAYRLLGDLQLAGYVSRSRHGRRNHYRVNPDVPLADPMVEDQSLGEFLRLTDRSGSSDIAVAARRNHA